MKNLKVDFNLSKKKKYILIVIAVVLFIILSAVIIAIKLKGPKEETTITHEDSYEIKGEETLKFNGISIISDEQIIIVDKSQGELKDIKVKDGQEVKKGDVLFSYLNTAVEDQIAQYDREINSNNGKVSRVKKEKDKVNTSINKLQGDLNAISGELNKVQSEISKLSTSEEKEAQSQYNELLKTKDVLEGKQLEVSQQIEMLRSQVNGIETEVASYEEGNKSIVTERDTLKKKIGKDIITDIDGVVKVNNKGIDDPTVAYMRIISKEPLVKAEVSEFDVKNLKIDEEVMLKVISSGEYIKGTITEIDELPIEEPGRTTTGYNFYIKPEKSIRIGFSLEVKCNYKGIEIPKDYVYEKDSKIHILKEKGDSYEDIEIKATLENDKYYLLDGAIGIGDRLIKNPSTVLEGSK